MLRRFGIGIAILLVLLVVLAAAAALWARTASLNALKPVADIAGQPSIASYAKPLASEPVVAVNLADDFSWDTIATPPKSARVWTRWWWPGGDVDTNTVVDQLTLLDDAGFGGVEIQPLMCCTIKPFAPDIMQRVHRFDTPSYYATLHAGIAKAAELGMQVDLTHFSGWPPGGPEVNLDDSLTLIDYAATTVDGGKNISVQLPLPSPGASKYLPGLLESFGDADVATFATEKAQLISVVATRQIGGERSANIFNLSDTVALDPASLHVITEHAHNGVLNWDAPPGQWEIIASYLMPSGEVPTSMAKSRAGYVVDHLRVPQVLGHYEYAFGDRTGLPAYYGKGLRGFFNDSLEFKQKRMAVADILAEFKTRRGYDLEPYLPAIYIEGIDDMFFSEVFGVHAAPEFSVTPLDARIRHDYQQTLSDLLVERFIETSAQWGAQHGLISRGQSYGMDLDNLRAMGANDIPETETMFGDGSSAWIKFASSAAALYGKPLVSSESIVWIARDYATTARHVKGTADKLFLAGVNHIIYHGTPYPWRPAPDLFGDEGWMPFSGPGSPAHFSENTSPGNTQLWPDVPAINTYIARSQNLLRQGHPDIDVLVYYPFLGYRGGAPTEILADGRLIDADPDAGGGLAFARIATKLFDAIFTVPKHDDERELWMKEIQPLLRGLEDRGVSWAWVNDHALQTGKVGAYTLSASKGSYGAILLANIPRIEGATLDRLKMLAGENVPVVLAGRLPDQQPGFKDAEQGDRRVQEKVKELTTLIGGASTFETKALTDHLAVLSAERQRVRYAGASTIHQYRRALDNGGAIYFFGNQDIKTASVELAVHDAQSAWWFDAVDGAAAPAPITDGRIALTLAGLESRFLVIGVPMPESANQKPVAGLAVTQATRQWPLTSWNFALGDFNAQWENLPNWVDVEKLRDAKGPGLYSQTFTLDKKQSGARYFLNLGLIHGSALIRVNGNDVARASLPPFTADISAALVEGENRIEVEVLAPLRNYFVGQALNENPQYSHMGDFEHTLAGAGLIGPVTLFETASEK